jgi:UPF0176 protein
MTIDRSELFEVISFYEFKGLGSIAKLVPLKLDLKQAMIDLNVRGTIIIAEEGYNGMVCGRRGDVAAFIARIEGLLRSQLRVKSSFAEKAPFRKTDVRVKPEIVTLKKKVDISLGENTHVKPAAWNEVISDPDTLVLDARNDYEFRTGSFAGAINPEISKFSELPEYVAANLDPGKQKRVAMFCTGGIRCEKFAPYLRAQGFSEVYQLEGGILKYLEEIPQEQSLWNGECFVFDERITVDASLAAGNSPDLSHRHENAKHKGQARE